MGNEKTPSHAVVSPVKSLHERDAVQSRGKPDAGVQEEVESVQRHQPVAHGLNSAQRSSVASRPNPAMSTECNDPGPLPREMSEEA
jgi:hypothetical protein